MGKLQQLIASRQKALAAAKSLRDLAKLESRDLLPAELTAIEGHLTAASDLKAEISRAHNDCNRIDREIDEEEAWDRQVRPARAVIDPLDHGPGSPDQYSPPPSRSAPRRAAGGLLASLFGESRGATGGFRSMGEFLSSVGNAQTHHDNRLQLASRAFSADMREGIDSAGGFAVPVEYARGIISGVLEKSIMLASCDARPMQSNELRVPAFDDADHSQGLLYGGVKGAWTAEGTTPSTSAPKLRQLRLHANKLFILCQVTSELLADAEGMEAELGRVLSEAGAFFIDDAMIATGTGAGQPLAVLNSPGVVEVSKDEGQAPATLTYSNLASMTGALHPSCFANSMWLVNPSCLPALLKLTVPVVDDEGTVLGGSHYPALSESNGALRLLTRPVVLTEKAKALGTKGDAILLDPKQYVAGVRQNIEIARSAHAGFESDTVYFRMIVRIDGQAKWNGPSVLRNGGQTGWAVVLEDRVTE